MLLLGFASGLPYQLINDPLKLMLAHFKVDPEIIAISALALIPYSLKVFWSPLVDMTRIGKRTFPRRRTWLQLTQGGLLVAIYLMGHWQQTMGLPTLFTVVLAIAVLSATQDMAGDAWRTDSLSSNESARGLAASLWVGSYRIAFLAAGGLLPWMADALQSWPLAFSYSALLLLPGVLGSFLAPEPALPEEAPRTFAQGFLVPFRDLIQRLGSRVLFVFAFVLLFKMGDSVLNALAVIFLKNSGYTDIVIGSVRSVAGLIATLAGVAIGGLVFLRLKTLPSLWIFGILQAVSNLAYVWLAGIPHPGFSPLVVIVVIENFCGGLATAAFTAFLMGVCNPAASAVQYALLTAVMSIGQVGIAASLSGYLISLPAMTWNLYFWISTLLGLPGLLLLPFLGKAVRNDRNPA